MTYNKIRLLMAGLVLAALTLLSCGHGGDGRLTTLTIAHLNDTHSHMEPDPVKLTIGGIKTTVRLGGFARLQTVVDEMRANNPNFLLLHAGDAVQGTLYFTLFNGQVEFDFLNRLGVDAMTLGNHEFDRGTAALAGFLRQARFPVVSSNIDFSGEPEVAPLVSTSIVKNVNGEQIGIIGLTTETTPQSTTSAGKTVFLDAQAAARREVGALESRGINKIVILSHLGYAEDMKLAAAVSGIDVIIGGHSHTLLADQGQLAPLGLSPAGPYPTEITTPDGGKTLVLQAWQWGHVLGRISLVFDQAGKVHSYNSGAVIPAADTFIRNGVEVNRDSAEQREIVQALTATGMVRIVPEDSAAAAALAPYSAQLGAFRTTVVATAAEDLIVTPDNGPGVLGADSMLNAVPKAQAAILNYGGVRKNLLRGNISVGDVLEVMPFANTLVLVDMTGAELKDALEGGIDFLITKYGNLTPQVLPYVAGMRLNVTIAAAKGSRVSSLTIKGSSGQFQPVTPDNTYRTVVNSFMAGGGDGFTAIKNAPGFRSDTGIIDSDAFRDYLETLGTVRNPGEQRVVVMPALAKTMTSASQRADNYWRLSGEGLRQVVIGGI